MSAIVSSNGRGRSPAAVAFARVVRVEPGELRMPHREPCLVLGRRARARTPGRPRRTWCRRRRRIEPTRGRRPSSPAPRDRRRRRCPVSACLDPIQDERAEVSRVDPLDRRVRWAGGEHLAAGRRPPNPIREAVGGVVRPHDVPGPDHEEPLRRTRRPPRPRTRPSVVRTSPPSRPPCPGTVADGSGVSSVAPTGRSSGWTESDDTSV